MKDSIKRFSEVNALLPCHLRQALDRLPDEIKARTFEIRLRCGQPVMLSLPGDPAFVLPGGSVTYINRQGTLSAEKGDIDETFRAVCGYSVYSHQNEIKNGFVILQGGHRAGICGTAVIENGQIGGVRDIYSLNLRIAREIRGAANEIVPLLRQQSAGLLIAGAPGSGKTTVLRDIARQLAGGENGAPARVALLDERGELAAVYRGKCRNNLGVSTDIISGCPKPRAIEMAVRTLSPDYILFDEIGTREELLSVEDGLHTGVKFITTMHAGSREEFRSRSLTCELLRIGAFSGAVLLKSRDEPSVLAEYIEMPGNLRKDGHKSAEIYRTWRGGRGDERIRNNAGVGGRETG